MTAVSTTREPSFVVLGYIRPFFKYLTDRGESLAPYLERLNLREDQLNQFDLQCSDESVSELFELAAERLADPNLGLRAGQEMHLTHVWLIGQMVLACGRASLLFDLRIRYYNLIDLVRKQQAEGMLKNPEVSLVDTALMLGFFEQSGFQRAFKRWFKTTPAEYRRQL